MSYLQSILSFTIQRRFYLHKNGAENVPLIVDRLWIQNWVLILINLFGLGTIGKNDINLNFYRRMYSLYKYNLQIYSFHKGIIYYNKYIPIRSKIYNIRIKLIENLLIPKNLKVYPRVTFYRASVHRRHGSSFSVSSNRRMVLTVILINDRYYHLLNLDVGCRVNT